MTICPQSLDTKSHASTDHVAVACTYEVTRLKETMRRKFVHSKPLRAGARPRRGTVGVARHPCKNDPCAKELIGKKHADGQQCYYCAKNFEKPRICCGKAAVIEDPRRKNLFRLCMQRNQQQMNGVIPLMCVWLSANTDAQAVTTAKGASDYVAKYISKYGAGQSVQSKIASIIDEIITKIPDSQKMTISRLLAKAFIATAVPDAVCCLEAWHVLFGLDRHIATRVFTTLNLDDQQALRNISPSVHNPSQQPPEDEENLQEEEKDTNRKRKRKPTASTTNLLRNKPIEKYLHRMSLQKSTGITDEWLSTCSFFRYMSHTEERQGKVFLKNTPNIIK